MKLNILLRGDTFKTWPKNENMPDETDQTSINLQMEGYKSMIKYILEPLKNKYDISIIVVAYKNINNHFIANIFQGFKYYYIEIEKTTQVKGFVKSLTIPYKFNLFENRVGVLILRNDLMFKKYLNFTELNPNKILFQWNLLHDKIEREMADQFQFIGGNMLKFFVYKINIHKINVKWGDTLHNLLNYCIQHFGPKSVGFLLKIEDPNPTENWCEIRGNPKGQWDLTQNKYIGKGNDIFNYLRFEYDSECK